MRVGRLCYLVPTRLFHPTRLLGTIEYTQAKKYPGKSLCDGIFQEGVAQNKNAATP